MGISDNKKYHPFTITNVLDRELVIRMLKYEETLTKGEFGQMMYRNPLNKPFISLTVEKALNRKVLSDFGFTTTNADVDMYRTIFRTYFRSPEDYDEEVINSVHYMRENKCVFYKHPPIEIGQKIPNCELYELDGKTKTTLHQALTLRFDGVNTPQNYSIFAAFSLS